MYAINSYAVPVLAFFCLSFGNGILACFEKLQTPKQNKSYREIRLNKKK